MEQECITALHQSLGMSTGAEFSSEDVSLLFSKVFHVPSSTSEAHAAMVKIAGGDNIWSGAGGNILDVLLEMEREMERREMLYWDFQLLNARNIHHMRHSLHQCTGTETLIHAYKSQSGFLQPCTAEMSSPRMEELVGGQELCDAVTNMKRLKKAARQCWARLASEGVQSLLRPPWQGQSTGPQGQAWGYVSLSDVLLLVEVKYDVVMQRLCAEMLQEHHTRSVWEMLLPWQQQEEVERLEDLAEEALESADILHLAILPGAFRIYKAHLDASLRNYAECREQSWSAVTLLKELHKCCQEERDTLTALQQRLATLKAQREKMSYSALLAARQSWETWPHVVSPCRADQIALWLYGEEEVRKEEFKTTEQKTALQLLVLTQEQERMHLIKLVHGVSLEDFQGRGYTDPPKESSEQAVLRAGCIKRLRQIHAQLSKQTNPQTPILGEWSQHMLDNCVLTLLTHLMELQDVQASALVQALADRDIRRVQAQQNKYEDEIQTQHFSNLLHLLISDAPLTSSSECIPNPNLTENSNIEQVTPRSSYTTGVKNVSGGSAEASGADSSGACSKMNEVHTADGSDKQDICSGVMEDLPYLEILCSPETEVTTNDSVTAEEGSPKGKEGGADKGPQSCKKQGSLITLAWSKPTEDGTSYDGDTADVEIEQHRDDKCSLKTHILSSHCKETVQERDVEELNAALTPCSSSSGHHDAQPVDQQHSIVQQKPVHQPDGGAAPRSDQQTFAIVAENLQPTQPHLTRDTEMCNHTTNSGETTKVEAECELWDLRGPELSADESPTQFQESAADSSLSESEALREATLLEREHVGEPLSALERERTMRNLVDMQRKVEERQQRDRERQLLRVQERLAIIHNRKTEEDLLGLKHTDGLNHLIQDLPLADRNQQKAVVRERLVQIRRERSFIMQSKRDRNTAGFKELLAPVALHSNNTEGVAD